MTTSPFRVLRPIQTVISQLQDFNVHQFRQIAFTPETPLLITTSTEHSRDTATEASLPATRKWFRVDRVTTGDEQAFKEFRYSLSRSYDWEKFKDVMLPYELMAPPVNQIDGIDFVAKFRKHLMLQNKEYLAEFLPSYDILTTSNEEKFHSFQAPLELFLEASRRQECSEHGIDSDGAYWLGKLYIAQAQIADLPRELQAALPTPRIVSEAGKGDIYDSNIWLGIPSTYTPLHKDPNPNLFVQLTSSKVVRLFRPDVGRGIFHRVQMQLGAQSSMSFRGEEMMQGPERSLLEHAVWVNPPEDGHEVVVRPGDALFIPKGWWHSIKSMGTDITASVNWWFR
jgi:hypothetical protein